MPHIGYDIDRERSMLLSHDWKLDEIEREDGPTMTVEGTIAKLFFLLILFAGAFLYTWHHFYALYAAESPGTKISTVMHDIPALQGFWPYSEARYPLLAWLLFFLFFGGTFLTKRGLVIVAPLFAIAQGISFGAFECVLQPHYPGITLICGLLVIGMFVGLFVIYWLGFAGTDNLFALYAAAARGGLTFLYAAELVLRTFMIDAPYLHQTPVNSQVFTIIALLIASGTVVGTFSEIEKAVAAGMPKWAEWRAAVCLFAAFLIVLKLVRRLVLRRSTGRLVWDAISDSLTKVQR